MSRDDIDQLYQEVIVDHDQSPRNHGPLDAATHRATVDNPLCGDIITLHLRIVDGVIRDLSFEGRGCALSRAAASILTTMLSGRSLSYARSLAADFDAFVQGPGLRPVPVDAGAATAVFASGDLGDLTVFAGVRRFRSRRACATLPFRALLAAIAESG